MQTLIIGGGLSGLALAHMLEAHGHDYLLVEARNRWGGRILTEHHGAGYFDMGPAWFWQGQPRIAALTDRLELTPFEQFYEGDLRYEDEKSRVQRGRGFSSMAGSLRLHGGLGALTGSLAGGLPATHKRLNTPVKGLIKTADGITTTFSDGGTVQASQVVLALPPRIAASLEYDPPLPPIVLGTMQNIATWMAGQAKAVAVYDTPFWRKDGLSGDATSRTGPMVEIHDASPVSGGPYALFGFIGVPPQGRVDEQVLRHHLLEQLGRLFGPQAAQPAKLYVQDWAHDPLTATHADQAPLYAHPTYGMPQAMAGLWNGTLHFSGTEVAPQFGGYLEGALEAAEITFQTLLK